MAHNNNLWVGSYPGGKSSFKATIILAYEKKRLIQNLKRKFLKKKKIQRNFSPKIAFLIKNCGKRAPRSTPILPQTLNLPIKKPVKFDVC